MTRFVYLADTHWGTAEMGYQMQQGYPDRLRRILDALEAWMAAAGPVDFVLHGGDMVDAGTADNIASACDLFSLSVPVYLCLGNHDLTEAGSAADWTRLAPGFFGPRGVDYTIETGTCLLHVAPNQWGPAPYRWADQQDPHFLAAQLETLEQALARRPDVVHILSTHSPVLGVPTAQTGYDGPFHQPPSGFTDQVSRLWRGHVHLRCVLGAHSHLNMCVEHEGVHCVTTSSLVETPFEFKLFEVDARGLAMSTVNLFEELDIGAGYDFDRAFVQGRQRDRALAYPLNETTAPEAP